MYFHLFSSFHTLYRIYFPAKTLIFLMGTMMESQFSQLGPYRTRKLKKPFKGYIFHVMEEKFVRGKNGILENTGVCSENVRESFLSHFLLLSIRENSKCFQTYHFRRELNVREIFITHLGYITVIYRPEKFHKLLGTAKEVLKLSMSFLWKRTIIIYMFCVLC